MSVQAGLRKTCLMTCAIVMLTVAGPFLSGQAAAAGYDVYVGYADDLRPSPFFPTPWQGDPTVGLFAGSNSPFDAGAIRVLNTSGGTITIDSLGVVLHPAVSGSAIALWGGSLPFSLAAGQSAIFTQTGQYNFDTSDSPIVAANLLDNCSVGPTASTSTCTGNHPTVDLSIDGVAAAYLDTGHVLDTGGFDLAAVDNSNESLQWRLIGTTGVENPGAVPEPSSFFLLGPSLAACAWALRAKRRMKASA
ncbi:MAG TPA: PEP-CTERM sorting domain-containing protein [bacterium]|nr:PEP-CTERM sorting domain-containing protein [bacterium]